MRRLSVVLAVAVLVLAACGSDSDGSPEVTEPDVQQSSTTGAQEPDINEDPATTAGGQGDLAITEVVFGEHVTITNLGSEPVSVDGLWLCNLPDYVPLPTALIAPGASIDISDLDFAADGGEVGLYTSKSFGDSAAMVDYVGWGSGGGRAPVAVAAGLWPDGDVVAATGALISAPSGGASSADWSTE